MLGAGLARNSIGVLSNEYIESKEGKIYGRAKDLCRCTGARPDMASSRVGRVTEITQAWPVTLSLFSTRHRP